MRDRPAVGRRGEALAVDHLQRKGYRILERNVRTRLGEIDIVARDGDCYVFVEVRARTSNEWTPEESVTLQKQRRIGRLGQQYLQDHLESEADWRGDVVAIELSRDGTIVRIEHIINAIEEQ
jgi:putative endonuclease